MYIYIYIYIYTCTHYSSSESFLFCTFLAEEYVLSPLYAVTMMAGHSFVYPDGVFLSVVAVTAIVYILVTYPLHEQDSVGPLLPAANTNTFPLPPLPYMKQSIQMHISLITVVAVTTITFIFQV